MDATADRQNPWKEYFTDDGKPYYHNSVSGVTQWQRPADFQQTADFLSPGPNNLASSSSSMFPEEAHHHASTLAAGSPGVSVFSSQAFPGTAEAQLGSAKQQSISLVFPPTGSTQDSSFRSSEVPSTALLSLSTSTVKLSGNMSKDGADSSRTSVTPFEVVASAPVAGASAAEAARLGGEKGSYSSDYYSAAEYGSSSASSSSSSLHRRATGSGSSLFSFLPFCSCCSDLSYLQSFFNVNTNDVVDRCISAALPIPRFAARISSSSSAASTFSGADSSNVFRSNPDFYGPFWIATTIIVFIFATFNSSVFVDSQLTVNYGVLGEAASLIYSAIVGVPLACYAGLSLLGTAHDQSLPSSGGQRRSFAAGSEDHSAGLATSETQSEACARTLQVQTRGEQEPSLRLRQLVCVYGYSLFIFIPVCLICLVHLFGQELPAVRAIEWVTVLGGLCISVCFTFRNLFQELAFVAPKFRYGMLSFLAVSQLFLFLFYKFHFLTNAADLKFPAEIPEG